MYKWMMEKGRWKKEIIVLIDVGRDLQFL